MDLVNKIYFLKFTETINQPFTHPSLLGSSYVISNRPYLFIYFLYAVDLHNTILLVDCRLWIGLFESNNAILQNTWK